MKSALKTIVLLLVGLGSSLAVNAEDNVLNATTAGTVSGTPAVPVISVNGIMTMGGAPQVLFHAGEKSYSLNAGDERDGIRVITINQEGGTITFDNHGSLQTIGLQKAVSTAYTPSVKPTPMTAAFISPAVAAPVATAPVTPAASSADEEQAVSALSSVPVQGKDLSRPHVVVIGSRTVAPAGFQRFNGLTTINNGADPDNSGFAPRPMIPGRAGLQPIQPNRPMPVPVRGGDAPEQHDPSGSHSAVETIMRPIDLQPGPVPPTVLVPPTGATVERAAISAEARQWANTPIVPAQQAPPPVTPAQ